MHGIEAVSATDIGQISDETQRLAEKQRYQPPGLAFVQADGWVTFTIAPSAPAEMARGARAGMHKGDDSSPSAAAAQLPAMAEQAAGLQPVHMRLHLGGFFQVSLAAAFGTLGCPPSSQNRTT